MNMRPSIKKLLQGVDGLLTLLDVFAHINQLVESKFRRYGKGVSAAGGVLPASGKVRV